MTHPTTATTQTKAPAAKRTKRQQAEQMRALHAGAVAQAAIRATIARTVREAAEAARLRAGAVAAEAVRLQDSERGAQTLALALIAETLEERADTEDENAVAAENYAAGLANSVAAWDAYLTAHPEEADKTFS